MTQYHDKITQIDSPINKGTARSLNLGIKEAKGEWIKWLSADDVMDPYCLECLINLCKDTNTIYYTSYSIIDKDGKHIRDFIEPERNTSDLWSFFYGNGSSSFIHRGVFEKCGLFDESLPHSEDYEFWLRATMIHGVKLTLMPRLCIKYRMHPDQLTNKVGGSLDKQIKEKIKSQLTARQG